MQATDETDSQLDHFSLLQGHPFSPVPHHLSLDSCFDLLLAFIVSKFAFHHSGPLQRTRWSLQKGRIVMPLLYLNSFRRFSPAVWRKQHSLPMNCGDLMIWPCRPLWLYLTLLYSLFQTFTPASFRSHHSTPAARLLVLSCHSGLNSNGTSSKRAFSGYLSQSNTLSPNHSVTVVSKVAQGAMEILSICGKQWYLNFIRHRDKYKNKNIQRETWWWASRS